MATKLRLLLIDDSEDDVAVVLRELGRAAYDISHRRVDTAEALRGALEAQPWDLVLSDLSMPGFDGLLAFEICKAKISDVPFLFVSGQIGPEQAVDAMRRGVRDV